MGLKKKTIKKDIEKMKQELKDSIIREAVKNIIWMARRYAEGRKTFAPMMFNDSYDILRTWLGEIDHNRPDTCLPEEYFPYAQDGMYDPKTSKFDAIGNRKYNAKIKEK